MDTPMGNEQMKAVMKELQDTMLLLADIETKPNDHTRDRADLRTQSEKLRARTEANLVEIRKKFNALIGDVAGQRPERPKG